VSQPRTSAFEAGLQHFANENFGFSMEGIGAIATSRSPMAKGFFDALAAGQLLFDPVSKKFFIKEMSGGIVDAATGEPASAASNLIPVEMSTDVRSVVEGLDMKPLAE
jgi:urea transport system permease protein